MIFLFLYETTLLHGEGDGLSSTQLAEKLGKTRQAIESARSKGTLSEIGYRAEKNGQNWLYWAVEAG